MNVVKSALLDESYYEYDHPSGLKILVYPKEGYQSAYAIFGTRYGSIDTRFRLKGEQEWTVVPEGIAHFLEHKLFESQDEDAFARYARTGANANAFTSFDRTCYLFSCTENFGASLEILLDFVQSPYFTKETVDKEQGIIGQEIRMYDDEPNWRVMFNLLTALYHTHPVRIDIAGTVESIAKIDADLLYKCYRTFYNLNNMVLAVAGKVDPKEVLAIADKALKPSADAVIERSFEEEPEGIVKDHVEQKLSVSVPLFMFGYKETPKAEGMDTQTLVEWELLLELIAGKTSPLYRRLLDEQLINESFGTELFEGRGYVAAMFAGESKDPDAVAQAVKAEIERLKKDGIDKDAFERVRRERYGLSVMAFDSVEGIANNLSSAHFTGRGLFDTAEVLSRVTCEQVQGLLKESLRPEHSALSTILPA